MIFWIVGLGGLLGAVARYYLGMLVSKLWPVNFPLGTFLINLLGSFLLGMLTGLSVKGLIPETLRLSAGVGFVGAFTTFSTFGYETVVLTESGQHLKAWLYILASVFCGLILAWFGLNITS